MFRCIYTHIQGQGRHNFALCTHVLTHIHIQLQGSGHDKFLNCAELNKSPNFLAVLVSATPYNVLTCRSRIPAKYCREEDTLDDAIGLDEWKVKSAEEQRLYDEVHVVRWFERDERSAGPYFRLEDYLHTVHSELRHVAAGMCVRARASCVCVYVCVCVCVCVHSERLHVAADVWVCVDMCVCVCMYIQSYAISLQRCVSILSAYVN